MLGEFLAQTQFQHIVQCYERWTEKKNWVFFFTSKVSASFCFSEWCHKSFKWRTAELAVAKEMDICGIRCHFYSVFQAHTLHSYSVKGSAEDLHCKATFVRNHLGSNSRILSARWMQYTHTEVGKPFLQLYLPWGSSAVFSCPERL